MYRIFIFVLCALLSGCNLSSIDGTLGASQSISFAKERDVFVGEYSVVKNPYLINDSLSILIKSAWLEHQWRYDGFFGGSTNKEKNGYQLILQTDSNSIRNHGVTWTIGLTGKDSFRHSSAHSLIISLDSLPKRDTLVWEVQEGRNLAPQLSKTIIGKFLLVRK
ncbi:MAG: hypothetical protein EOO43_00630 [Flavobacterium sp.]|nr:MAG: hypothetical protein EOO43_00630 [Flavobacterium sp.]